MAILVVVSVYFFNLNANLNSWLGVLSVLVTTWVYMNIAIKMPKEVAPSEEKSGLPSECSAFGLPGRGAQSAPHHSSILAHAVASGA